MSNYTINNPKTLINGIEYNWSTVSFSIGLYTFSGITDISYTEAMQKQFLYGRGNKAVAFTPSNYELSGSITIHKSELEILHQSALEAGKKSILELEPFVVTIIYRSLDNVRLITEVLEGVSITNITNSTTQGDEAVTVTLDFISHNLSKATI